VLGTLVDRKLGCSDRQRLLWHTRLIEGALSGNEYARDQPASLASSPLRMVWWNGPRSVGCVADMANFVAFVTVQNESSKHSSEAWVQGSG